MRFETPLIAGTFVRRYKRFFAEMVRDDTGETIIAHCANSGKMLGLLNPGARCWVSVAANPLRKLPYTWELVEADGTWVGVNTMRPNGLAEEGILSGKILPLKGYTDLKREVKYGQNSRIDLLLTGEGQPPCYVEVKQVHLCRGPYAVFPDCVTERGAKHLRELAQMCQQGARSVMVYVAQRDDCQKFALAKDLDPVYTAVASEAKQQGVEFMAYACRVDAYGVDLYRALEVEI